MTLNLEEDLEYAYNLLTQRFHITFHKPTLNHSTQGLSEETFMRHLGEANEIQLSRYVHLEMVSRHERLYGFLHELGHCYVEQTNPQLSYGSTSALLHSLSEEDWEKGMYYVFFREGAADYLAIESCLASADAGLKVHGESRMEDLLSGHSTLWEQLDKETSKGEEKKDVDAPSALVYGKYKLGYRFTAHLEDEDLMKAILHPPSTATEFFNPEAYLKTLREEQEKGQP